MPAPQMTILDDAVAMVAVVPCRGPLTGPRPSVREEVLVLEASEVEAGSFREEAEAGLCRGCSAFAGEHGVELGLERVQVEHVAGGVVLLLVRQLVRAPVGALLLLGKVDAEELAAQVLEAVAIGVGARQLGSDLGAVDGLGKHAPMLRQHGDIEAPEVKDLEHRAIRQESL